MITLTLPSTPEQIADVPSKDLRKVARAMGVSPTITNAAGTRIYKPSALLRMELEKFLDTPPVEVPQMDAEVIIEPTPQGDVKVVVNPGITQKRIKPGTKLEEVLNAMTLGATLAELRDIVPQPHGYFHWDLKGKSLGVNKVGDRFFLVLPQGQTELIYK